MATLSGIHHITAITADAQANIDFYTGVLGLRLVKLTVNFDDPSSYHLYYGDETGSPGTILTFFAWPEAPRGRVGAGQVSATAFSVPEGSLDFWRDTLQKRGITVDGPQTRFDESVLRFADPDGMHLELISSPARDRREPWSVGGIPAEHAIRGFYGASLSEEGYEQTAHLLTEVMSFRLERQEDNRFQFAVGDGGPGATIDVLCQPNAMPGRVLAGTVHHIAWRAPDDLNQNDWRRDLARLGYNVSPIMDRNYFHSIYFREPGGILFEIATDGPGFTADEPQEKLGTSLKLPSQYEPIRSRLEEVLPKLKLPGVQGDAS